MHFTGTTAGTGNVFFFQRERFYDERIAQNANHTDFGAGREKMVAVPDGFLLAKLPVQNQIDSLDEYIQYVEDYYEDLFEHPQKLIAEMEEIMQQFFIGSAR